MTWQDYAACRNSEADFFPEPAAGRYAADPAKSLCMGCFVRGQCLDHAIVHHELGIWGGTTEKERKRIEARYIRQKRKALSLNVSLG